LGKKWHKVLTGDSTGDIWSSPVVAGGVVYVGTNASTGDLYAFDADDGTELRHITLDSPIHGTPCVADGRVYVGTERGPGGAGEGTLYALYAADQQGHSTLDMDWTFECDSADHIWGSPVVHGGAVYFGTSTLWPSGPDSGCLYTVDLTTRSKRITPPPTISYGVRYPTPAIDASFAGGARCYVSDFSCYLTAFDCSTGECVWEWRADDAAMFSSPSVYDGYVFVGSGDNRVYRLADSLVAIGAYEGTNALVYAGDFSPTASVYSTITTLGGRLYFGCEDERVYAVDSDTLSQVWQSAALGSAVTSSSAISAPTGVLFTATSNGSIIAFDAETGDHLWQFNLHDPLGENWTTAQIKSSPAIANDRLFIVAGDGSERRLYFFGP